MRFMVRSLMMAALAVVPAGMASAAQTLSYTYSFGNPTLQPTEIENSFSLAGFNSSLGTLQSVLISYDYSIKSAGYIVNLSPGPVTFKESAVSDATITLGGALSHESYLSPATQRQTFSNVASGATVTFAETVASASGSYAASLASFLLDTPITGIFSSDTNMSEVISSGGNADKHVTTSGAGNVTVTYSYAPPETISAVPENGTWAMMVLGFAAAGATLRRRRPELDAHIG